MGTLREACAKTGWQVRAFCLMPNQTHLVVGTPRANLVAAISRTECNHHQDPISVREDPPGPGLL